MAKRKVKQNPHPTYILPSVNKDLSVFIDNYKNDMLEQVVASISYALENGLSIIEVFQFKNSQFVVRISEHEFESNLENIYNQYMKDEAYELCSKVSKLRELLKKKNDEKQKTLIRNNQFNIK